VKIDFKLTYYTTVKHVLAVTSIKQSPVLKGHIIALS